MVPEPLHAPGAFLVCGAEEATVKPAKHPIPPRSLYAPAKKAPGKKVAAKKAKGKVRA